MKRFLTTFLFCLLLSAALPCGAQNTRPWTAGPLSWSEFSQVQGEDAASYASFSLMRENRIVKAKGISWKYQDVCAAFDPGQSWYNPWVARVADLQRHQQEFDILQHFAAQYRDDFLFYNDQQYHRFEEFLGDDEKGKLSEAAYLERYRAALDAFHATGDASPYPASREPFDITRFPVRMAAGSKVGHFSFLSVFPLGGLAQLFPPAFGFSGGLGYREGKSVLGLDLLYGICGLTIEGDEAYKTIFTSGVYLGFLASYSRVLFSVGKAECSLFGGVGYTSWKKGVVMNHPLACGLTLSEGITADIPLHRTYNFLAKSPQAQDLGVRVKLYVDEMYVAAQKTVMPTVNLSVGVNFGFTKLSRAE